MVCVIAYQRPISTQVLFYVLTPIGHKRAPMQDDVYFMLGRKMFFFSSVCLGWTSKVPRVLAVHIILVIPNGKQQKSSGSTVWERFCVGVTCWCERLFEDSDSSSSSAENLWLNVSWPSARDVRGAAGPDSVAAAGPDNHVAVLFEDDVGAVVKVED